MIEVIVADDQTLVRQGIRSLLELSRDFAVVAEANDGEEALRAVRSDMQFAFRTHLSILLDNLYADFLLRPSG